MKTSDLIKHIDALVASEEADRLEEGHEDNQYYMSIGYVQALIDLKDWLTGGESK